MQATPSMPAIGTPGFLWAQRISARLAARRVLRYAARAA
jgi:hypothetical protein